MRPSSSSCLGDGPKGTAKGDLDAYRPIALGLQDTRMLMTALMRSFKVVLARKGMAAYWLFGAMPGSTAAAPVSLAQRRLQRGQWENHVLAFDFSKALDTILLSSYATWGFRGSSSSSSIPSVEAPQCALSPCTAPPRPSASIVDRGRVARKALCSMSSSYVEPLVRTLARRAQGDARHAVPALVQTYCDDVMMIAHTLPHFLGCGAQL